MADRARDRRLTAAEQLRSAIAASGLSEYAIAQRSGVAQSVISRFMREQQGISLATFERLCETLGVAVALRRG